MVGQLSKPPLKWARPRAVSVPHHQWRQSDAFGSSGGSRRQQLAPGSLGNTDAASGTGRITRTAGSFIGADNSDATFVGANSMATGGGTSTGGFGGLSGGLNGGFGGMSGLGGFRAASRGGGMLGANANSNSRNRNNMNAMGRSNTRQINVRTQLDVGFRYVVRPTTRVETTLVKMLNSKRIARSRGILGFNSEKGTATLTGRVATRSDRDLAVRIAKQEPGVQTVLDQLVVESPDQDALSPSDARQPHSHPRRLPPGNPTQRRWRPNDSRPCRCPSRLARQVSECVVRRLRPMHLCGWTAAVFPCVEFLTVLFNELAIASVDRVHQALAHCGRYRNGAGLHARSDASGGLVTASFAIGQIRNGLHTRVIGTGGATPRQFAVRAWLAWQQRVVSVRRPRLSHRSDGRLAPG